MFFGLLRELSTNVQVAALLVQLYPNSVRAVKLCSKSVVTSIWGSGDFNLECFKKNMTRELSTIRSQWEQQRGAEAKAYN